MELYYFSPIADFARYNCICPSCIHILREKLFLVVQMPPTCPAQCFHHVPRQHRVHLLLLPQKPEMQIWGGEGVEAGCPDICDKLPWGILNPYLCFAWWGWAVQIHSRKFCIIRECFVCSVQQKFSNSFLLHSPFQLYHLSMYPYQLMFYILTPEIRIIIINIKSVII